MLQVTSGIGVQNKSSAATHFGAFPYRESRFFSTNKEPHSSSIADSMSNISRENISAINTNGDATPHLNIVASGNSDQMVRVRAAIGETDLLGKFNDILPRGHTITFEVLDKNKLDAVIASNGNNFVFTSLNENHIYVHPERVLGYQLDYLASMIGHEFIHAKDHSTGDLKLGDAKSIARSEVRAYDWQIDTASEFQLSKPQIDFLKKQLAYFKQLVK